MKTIANTDLYAGRKRLRNLLDIAMSGAASARLNDTAADQARNMLRFHAGLKTRHLDSLVVCPNGAGAFTSFLLLKDVPRGMPNIVGAAGENMSELQAELAGRSILQAACIMILDHKEAMGSGPVEQIRRFEVGQLAFGVPEEVISVIANRMPVKLTDANREGILAVSGALIRRLLSRDGVTEAGWADLSDELQGTIMVEAARLLCVGVNRLDAAA